MAALPRKLQPVVQEKAAVFRESGVFRVSEERWREGGGASFSIEVETDIKETILVKKELFFMIGGDNRLSGCVELTLPQGFRLQTIEAKVAMALRRRGMESVSRLREELRDDDFTCFGEDGEGRAVIGNQPQSLDGRGAGWSPTSFDQEAFLREHLIHGHIMVDVDLEVAMGKELDMEKRRLEQFSFEVGKLHHWSTGHDYKLVCEGVEEEKWRTELPCHKAILVARSPVIARGLARGEHLGRSVRDQWEVMGASYEAVKALVSFLYSADVPCEIEDGLAVEVLRLADYFEVVELKELAKEEMIRTLDARTALQTLVVIEECFRTDGGAARALVLHYIGAHAGAVVQGDGWEGFVRQHPGLVTAIVREMAK